MFATVDDLIASVRPVLEAWQYGRALLLQDLEESARTAQGAATLTREELRRRAEPALQALITHQHERLEEECRRRGMSEPMRITLAEVMRRADTGAAGPADYEEVYVDFGPGSEDQDHSRGEDVDAGGGSDLTRHSSSSSRFPSKR